MLGDPCFGAFVAEPASSVEKRAAEREITATSTFVAQSPPLALPCRGMFLDFFGQRTGALLRPTNALRRLAS
jgi:hypothetical protein